MIEMGTIQTETDVRVHQPKRKSVDHAPPPARGVRGTTRGRGRPRPAQRRRTTAPAEAPTRMPARAEEGQRCGARKKISPVATNVRRSPRRDGQPAEGAGRRRHSATKEQQQPSPATHDGSDGRSGGGGAASSLLQSNKHRGPPGSSHVEGLAPRRGNRPAPEAPPPLRITASRNGGYFRVPQTSPVLASRRAAFRRRRNSALTLPPMLSTKTFRDTSASRLAPHPNGGTRFFAIQYASLPPPLAGCYGPNREKSFIYRAPGP